MTRMNYYTGLMLFTSDACISTLMFGLSPLSGIW